MSNQVWESWRDDRLANLTQQHDELLAILSRIIKRATAPMSDGDILLSDVEAARIAIAKCEKGEA